MIPGLPEDMALECLIRVPFHRFGPARSVCRTWKEAIESPSFHRLRKLRRLTRPVLALSHAGPSPSPSGPAHKYRTPSFRLSLLDPSSSDAAWTPLPPIPGLPHGLPLFCQLASSGRNLVVLGGWDPETLAPTGAVHVYDFAAAAWRAGSPMPGPKRSFFACASSGGTVFVAGGHDEEKNALRSALAYDVATDRWAPLPDMAAERDECTGALLLGRFLVLGGYPTDHQGRFVASSESLDAAARRWGPVEEGALGPAACPRTCVAGDDGRLFMCRNGHVEASCGGGAWRALARVPEDASVAPVLATWQGRLVLVGSGAHGGAQQAYVMEDGAAAWKAVEVPEEYSGHVQAACCVEI